MIYNESKFNKEWDTKKLEELGDFSRGISRHRPRNDPALFEGGTYPLVQTGDVKNATIYIRSHSQAYNEFGIKQSKLWEKGTLCITTAANIANTAILSYPMCFPDSVVGFKAFDGICSELFMHYIFAYVRQSIAKSASGSIQDNINIDYLSKQLEFKIPEKSYQDKIVSVLVPFDEKIENNVIACEKLMSVLTTVFEHWFLQFDFIKNDKPYKTSGGKMKKVDGYYTEVPEYWDVKTIGDILIEHDKSPIQVNQVENSSGKIPFFTSGEEILRCEKPLVKGENIFMSTGGESVLDIFSGEASYSTDTWCIHANKYTMYLFFFLKAMNKRINDYLFVGSGLHHLQKDELELTKIPIPSDDVIEKFNNLALPILKKKSCILNENLELSNRKNELLLMLMNGQIKVGE